MRLYPLNAPRTAIDDPVWGHFDADPQHGGFDLPDELSDTMHSFHHRGKPVWETEDERSLRMHGDDLARRRDPAALYDAVGNITDAFKQIGAAIGAAQLQAPATPAVAEDSREAELEALRARVAELEATQAPVTPPASDGKPPARGRGGTAKGAPAAVKPAADKGADKPADAPE
jgi:hypothetical protein